MHVAIALSYNGARFHGCAPQDNVETVYGVLKRSLIGLGIDSKILYASRTDKGVHATFWVASFFVEDFWRLDRLRNLLNCRLYPHIWVRRIWKTREDFHPRFDAVSRAYRYIFTSSLRNIWLSEFVSKVRIGDVGKLKEGLSHFVGRHDFRNFARSSNSIKNCVREIHRIRLYQRNIFHHKVYVAYFVGNSFLYSQIRFMMGTALAYSLGEISLRDLIYKIEGKDNIKQKHFSVSGNGLYLCGIRYRGNSWKEQISC